MAKFFLMEMNRNGIPLNGIPFTGIPFLFLFADRTNGNPCKPLSPAEAAGADCLGECTYTWDAGGRVAVPVMWDNTD